MWDHPCPDACLSSRNEQSSRRRSCVRQPRSGSRRRQPDDDPAAAQGFADSRASASTLDYLVLDEALASGLVEITEVSEQGSVPELKFINRGPKPVLIVDGEELLGAKQNRIVNLTILVAANSELTIPVSCVEAGRWRSRSRAFTSAPEDAVRDRPREAHGVGVVLDDGERRSHVGPSRRVGRHRAEVRAG